MELAEVRSHIPGAPDIRVALNWPQLRFDEEYFSADKPHVSEHETNQESGSVARGVPKRGNSRDKDGNSSLNESPDQSKVKVLRCEIPPSWDGGYKFDEHFAKRAFLRNEKTYQHESPFENPQCGETFSVRNCINQRLEERICEANHRLFFEMEQDKKRLARQSITFENSEDALYASSQKWRKGSFLRYLLPWNLLCGTPGPVVSFPSTQYPSTPLLESFHHSLQRSLGQRAIHLLESHKEKLTFYQHQLQSKCCAQIDCLHIEEEYLINHSLLSSIPQLLKQDLTYAILRKQSYYTNSLLRKREEALYNTRARDPDCYVTLEKRKVGLLKLLKAIDFYEFYHDSQCESQRSNQLEHDREFDEEVDEQYLDLVDHEEWWTLVQARFENLVFSPRSRYDRVLHRISMESLKIISLEENEMENDIKQQHTHYKRNSLHQLHSSKHAGLRASTARYINSDNTLSPHEILETVWDIETSIVHDFQLPKQHIASLKVLVERSVYPRAGLACFPDQTRNRFAVQDIQWRKQCRKLRRSGRSLEILDLSPKTIQCIRSSLPSKRLHGRGNQVEQHGDRNPNNNVNNNNVNNVMDDGYSDDEDDSDEQVFFLKSIAHFSNFSFTSDQDGRLLVPCDLLAYYLECVVVLHEEGERVLGTRHFSIDSLFPFLMYALVHSRPLKSIHALLYVLQNYAIPSTNVNGEEAYYVYCLHAVVEHICNLPV